MVYQAVAVEKCSNPIVKSSCKLIAYQVGRIRKESAHSPGVFRPHPLGGSFLRTVDCRSNVIPYVPRGRYKKCIGGRKANCGGKTLDVNHQTAIRYIGLRRKTHRTVLPWGEKERLVLLVLSRSPFEPAYVCSCRVLFSLRNGTIFSRLTSTHFPIVGKENGMLFLMLWAFGTTSQQVSQRPKIGHGAACDDQPSRPVKPSTLDSNQ